jgi:hypothetical protein
MECHGILLETHLGKSIVTPSFLPRVWPEGGPMGEEVGGA